MAAASASVVGTVAIEVAEGNTLIAGHILFLLVISS